MKTTLILLAMAPFLSLGQVLPTGRPGSYQVTEAGKQGVQAAAAFAVAQQSKNEGNKLELKKVSQAQQQVVAGMNYQLQLQVIRKGKEATAKATVFRGLDSHFELKSWQWLDQAGS